MMKGEAVKPLRHNVNCSAAIFGRPQLGHFKAQGRAIFSPKFSKKFSAIHNFIFINCMLGFLHKSQFMSGIIQYISEVYISR